MSLMFHFDGNTPSKKNQKRILKTKQGRPFIKSSEQHDAWHTEAMYRMNLQRAAFVGFPFPIPKCERVAVVLYYADQRRRDASNTLESVMDLLVDAGILADDRWQVVGDMAIMPRLRKGRPGWEIQIVTPGAP